MNKKGKIALVVYTALFLLITKARRVINGLQFRFNGLQLLSTFGGGTMSKIRLNLLLRNPLPFSITIDSIQGQIYAQGVRMTNYEYDVDITTPIDIKGRSITPVSLDFYVDWRKLGEAVKQNVLTGDITTFTVQFVGVITVSGHAFNVSKTISYYDLVQ